MSKVVSKRLAYDELPGCEDEVVDPSVAGKLVKGMFSSLAKLCSLGLRSIAGTKKTPSWHNPAPTRECIVDSDLDLCRLLWRENIFGQGSKARLDCLLSGHHVAVRNSALFGNKWFVPLSDGAHLVRMGWPLVEQQVAGVTYLLLATTTSQSDTPFLDVLDVEEWQAIGIEWTSPIARMQHHGAKAKVFGGILARIVDKACGLVQLAAKRGFFDLPKSALHIIAKELGLDTTPDESCLERCRRLILHVLPG